MSTGELSFNNLFLITSLHGPWQILMKRNNRKAAWTHHFFGFQWSYCAERMNDAFIHQLQFHCVYKLLFCSPLHVNLFWTRCEKYPSVTRILHWQMLYTISVVVPHALSKTDKASLNCVCQLSNQSLLCLLVHFKVITKPQHQKYAAVYISGRSRVEIQVKWLMMSGINNPHVSAAGWQKFSTWQQKNFKKHNSALVRWMFFFSMLCSTNPNSIQR